VTTQPARQRAREPRTGRLRWVGAAAAVALAGASWGAGSRPTLHTSILWPGVTWWADTGGSPLLTCVAILAMAVLVTVWWRLRDAKVTTRWWWRTSAAWFVPLVASVPLYSRDLYSYAAQGALWLQGLSPYDHTVAELDSPWRDSTAPTWLHTTAPYGPVFLLVARGVAAVSGGQLWVALLLLRLVAVVAVVVIAWAVADLARRLGAVAPERATWLAVAAPLVGAHFVSGGHNDAVMVAGVLAGLALALRGRFVGACVLVSLATMVKVTAVVALPFVALLWAFSSSRRGASSRREANGRSSVRGLSTVEGRAWGRVVWACGSAAAVAGVVIVGVTLAAGLGWSWLNPADTSGKNEQWTSLPTGLGMAIGAVGHLLGHPEWRETGITVMRAVGLVVLAVLLVTIWLRTARRLVRGDSRAPASSDHLEPGEGASAAGIVRAAGGALLSVVVLAPVFLGWYFLWALPLLAVTIDPVTRRRAVTWLAVVATILCFMQLPDGYSLGLTTTAIGVPIDIVATVLLVRAGWRHRTLD
jgi:alpha-1,6-mannosyltransferase